MDTTKVVKVFKADKTLSKLRELGDFFGMGDELAGQIEGDMTDFYKRGEKWADKCRINWSELKSSVPWATGNLSFSISTEDGFENKKAEFWVGVDLKKLLEPVGKELPITNYIDYREEVEAGKEVEVASKDYTAAVNEYNRTGPDHFIENVWYKYAQSNLSEVMK